MGLTINEIISNMRDELERTSSLLDWLSNEYPHIYKEIQDSELGDELKQDIENDLERINDISIYEYAVEVYSNEGFRYQIDVFNDYEAAEA